MSDKTVYHNYINMCTKINNKKTEKKTDVDKLTKAENPLLLICSNI